MSKFYPHIYFNPETGYLKGTMISKEEQIVSIRGKEFAFGEYEMIQVAQGKKWTQKEVDLLAKENGNMKLVKFFEDSKKYFRVCIYENVGDE